MPKLRIQRFYYRNSEVYSEARMSDGQFHGLSRTWHRNGQIASEETYRQGKVRGICRQWSEAGKLLGSYQIQNGTGIQLAWYEDGRLQMEFSTVKGKSTGRKRFWLRDGALSSEGWMIENFDVSKREYLRAAASHDDWPRYSRERNPQRPLSRKRSEVREFDLHCKWLLSKSNHREAAKWLSEGSAASRSLGHLGYRKAKLLIASALAKDGSQVLAADIYRSKQGMELCDSLLIRLPRSRPPRLAIRQLFEDLSSSEHCAVLPLREDGRKWLYIYFA